MRPFVSLVSGALFALGLIISDMVNPARVLGFLDIAGDWDPTLAFVMAGALVPMALAWRLAAGATHPFAGDRFPEPASRMIDSRLVGGAALFGAGWGLVGFCPGPALTALGTGNAEAFVFTVAMVVGMFGYALATPSPRGV